MRKTMVLGGFRNLLEVKEIDPRGRFWLVVGGTTALPGDVVRFPRLDGCLAATGKPLAGRLSPLDAEIVVDSVTRSVILPECGHPASRFKQAMALVRDLESSGLSDQAQIVRDWLQPTLDEEFHERDAA
jgi:hypothetical protein